MELGTFSVSLAVKDIEASKLFYEKLGFAAFAGDQSKNWLIMKNGSHAIGCFKACSTRTFSPSTPAGTAMLNHWSNSPTFESCSASSRSVAWSWFRKQT